MNMKKKIASCYEIRNLFTEGCIYNCCPKYNHKPLPEPCLLYQTSLGIEFTGNKSISWDGRAIVDESVIGKQR